jgi:hypothetical protein
LNPFISLVFKDERIKTITDARKHIEEEFDSSYKGERDLLGYLKHKQDKQPQMMHLPPEPKSLPKRKSMMEDDYCEEEEEEMAMMREQMRENFHRRHMMMDEGEEDEEMMEIDEGSRH